MANKKTKARSSDEFLAFLVGISKFYCKWQRFYFAISILWLTSEIVIQSEAHIVSAQSKSEAIVTESANGCIASW